jgi:type IV pilus assembly protein PilA
MLRHYPTGFTLIEIMLVVAIVGFLASIALPQYQSYSTRARLTEAVQMLGAARISVVEYALATGKIPPDMQAAGLESLGTEVVQQMAYTLKNNQPVLSVQVKNTGSAAADNKWFSMEGTFNAATSVISWKCRPGAAAGPASDAVPPHLLPGSCRPSAKG